MKLGVNIISLEAKSPFFFFYFPAVNKTKMDYAMCEQH
jgi:hypothetical protein